MSLTGPAISRSWSKETSKFQSCLPGLAKRFNLPGVSIFPERSVIFDKISCVTMEMWTCQLLCWAGHQTLNGCLMQMSVSVTREVMHGFFLFSLQSFFTVVFTYPVAKDSLRRREPLVPEFPIEVRILLPLWKMTMMFTLRQNECLRCFWRTMVATGGWWQGYLQLLSVCQKGPWQRRKLLKGPWRNPTSSQWFPGSACLCVGTGRVGLIFWSSKQRNVSFAKYWVYYQSSSRLWNRLPSRCLLVPFERKLRQSDVVAHDFNPTRQEVEAGVPLWVQTSLIYIMRFWITKG